PASRPAQRAARLANGGILRSHDAIVVFGHGTKLGAERKWRLLANVLHRFRVHAAGRRQGIADLDDAWDIGQNVGERVAADVPRTAISHAVIGLEIRTRFRRLAILPVAKTQEGRAVALDFEHADALGVVT